jgi:uncharacterized protein YcnI
MKNTRTLAGASVALALGTVLALGAPLGASAHVSLDENTAEAGSYALLTFKVPNESDAASTTSVTVTLPTDTPFVSARTVPVPGWDAEIVTSTLPEPVEIGETTVTEAPTSIVWTATGDGLGDGELGLFPFSVGPVPDVGFLELPVDQGYSDGSVVTWAGDEVPILYVNDAPAGDHHGDDAEGEGDEVAGATTAPDSTAVAGLIVGSLGLVLGASSLALTLIRRRPVA